MSSLKLKRTFDEIDDDDDKEQLNQSKRRRLNTNHHNKYETDSESDSDDESDESEEEDDGELSLKHILKRFKKSISKLSNTTYQNHCNALSLFVTSLGYCGSDEEETVESIHYGSVSSFLGYFLIRKTFSSASAKKQCAATIKKLCTFMERENMVKKGSTKEIRDLCAKASKDLVNADKLENRLRDMKDPYGLKPFQIVDINMIHRNIERKQKEIKQLQFQHNMNQQIHQKILILHQEVNNLKNKLRAQYAFEPIDTENTRFWSVESVLEDRYYDKTTDLIYYEVMAINGNLWILKGRGTDLMMVSCNDSLFGGNHDDEEIEFETEGESMAQLAKVGWVILMALKRDKITHKWRAQNVINDIGMRE